MRSRWTRRTQAARFNRRLVNACLRAHTQAEPVRPGQLHVAIIGAGATGTELSAELHRTARQVVAYGLDRIDPDKDIRITLIEAAPRILPGPARAHLRGHHGPAARTWASTSRTSSKVSEVRADGVALADGRFVPAELIVWAAGVRGPDVLTNLDGPGGSAAPTSSWCSPPCRPRATPTSSPSATAPTARARATPDPVPPRAQAAHQQASHMVGQIERHLRGEPLKPFVYRDFGSLVSLGEYSTVGNLMGFIAGKSMLIEGYFARLMYRSLYKMHQTALHGMFKTAMSTLGRMITRQTEPRVKLH